MLRENNEFVDSMAKGHVFEWGSRI
jgi:hypothetical protein